jgi:ribosomal protein S27E
VDQEAYGALVVDRVSLPRSWGWRHGGAGFVRERPTLYRPRHPESTDLYRLIEGHFEEFAAVHEERFEAEDGPLRPVVRRVVEAFLDCGRPESGFARVRCLRCGGEFFVPASCQTRNFCPSCQMG